MKNFMKSSIYLYSILFTFFLFSTALFSQDNHQDAHKKAEEEMKAMLGTVPAMFEAYPDHVMPSAWEWFKASQSPDGAIPAKYTELISLGVASQIPCNYCIYAHTTMAKMHGATKAEIEEAIASAAYTRHWSTILNGAEVSLDDFKKEWDGILEHMKKQ